MAEGCVFCAIGAGKMPSKKVYEDGHSMAFLDINPRNPGHTIVIPKAHHDTILDMPQRQAGELFSSVKKVAVAVKGAAKADGISIAQSNGKAAGQVIPHVHFHVIPRFQSEGPISLEGVLSVKKLDDKSLDKIVESIKNSFSVEEEEPESEDGDEEEIEDDDDVNFNF